MRNTREACEEHPDSVSSCSIPEQSSISLVDLPLASDNRVNVNQLVIEEGGLDVRHTVVVSEDIVDVTFRGHPMVTRLINEVIQLLVCGVEHTTLSTGDQFVCKE
jgi:hypothetical protein